jgi:hypothetical protein
MNENDFQHEKQFEQNCLNWTTVCVKNCTMIQFVWANQSRKSENASDLIHTDCKYQCNEMDESDFQHEKQLRHKISSAIMFVMANDDREFETLGE